MAANFAAALYVFMFMLISLTSFVTHIYGK